MEQYNCRQATRLMLQEQDRELTSAERAALQFHLGICSACRKFRNQAEVMRQAMARWRSYRNSDKSDSP
ncbi:MAG TPA: zf-HC2 domain-containing protein [Burkholderiaceae bacterium]|nr:zf-HC2 domain-containing protein [Burkholderiaceae bacterium]